MLTRRTVLKQGGYAALASSIPLLIRPVRAQTATFDFYISTSGNDSNPGTLASPWSITALNSQHSVYAGKRVGIIAGTYNTYTLNQAGAWSKPGLSVNGGTASSPTYVASCDTSGNYSPRAATLTALSPSGAYPTNESGIIGQAYGTVANSGNVTLDGLVVTGSYEYGIVFYPGGGSASTEGGPSGVTIQNCEISNISGYENDNLGGILLWSLTGVLVHNCKIYNCVPTSGELGNQDCAGIFSFYCHSNIYEYNTIYNTTCGIYDKNAPNGNHTYRYNYIEQSKAVGPYALFAFMDCAGGNSGDVSVAHHNILIAPQTWSGTNPSHDPSLSGLKFYNNTCYYSAGGFSLGALWFPASASGSSMVTTYNNIFTCNGNPGYQGFLNLVNGSVALSDYNAYSSSGAFFGLASAGGSSTWTPTLFAFSAWQAKGFDAHGQIGTPAFASPTSLNPSGYQLNAGVGKGTGSTTGTTGGTACDMGAWGYDPALGGPPTQIGCNFGPVPSAPILTVS